LLETIRVYATEKLASHGEIDMVRGNHAKYIRDLVVQATGNFKLRLSNEDLTRLGQQIDNVRAALEWSFSESGDARIGVELTAAYAPVWLHLSLAASCRERCERALATLESAADVNPLLQLQLYMALTSALISAMGPAQQVSVFLTKLLEIAEDVDDIDAQLRALRHLNTIHVLTGNNYEAMAAVFRLSEVAHRTGDAAVMRLADRLMANRLQSAGNFSEARLYFTRVLQSRVKVLDQQRASWPHFDDRALARAWLARQLWLQGFADKAADEVDASLEELQPADHPLSYCQVLYYGGCSVAFLSGNFGAAERAILRLIDVATTFNATFWNIAGRCLEGRLLIERHEFAKGSAQLEEMLDASRRAGWLMSHPELKGALARAFVELGQHDEALGAVNEALAIASLGGEQWYVAELFRIKGELLLRPGPNQSFAAAKRDFERAISVARKQEALAFELRAALSLSRFMISQHRHGQVLQILEPLFDRFSEGLDAPDLRAARAILDTLR
jgi:predicted ATPase